VRLVLDKLSKIDGRPTVQGSYAKDTWISGNLDVDIFMITDADKIDYEKYLDDIQQVLGGKWIRRYAQHPFLEGYINDVKINIVPAHDIKKTGKLITPVDRTPLHTEYVRRHSELVDDIRLMKAMAKAMGFYGSEIKVRGFSGYLLEVLVIHYGGFLELLQKSQNWYPGYIIDTMSYYTKDYEKKLKERFAPAPFIVIDPVDKERNCAASLSLEKLVDMILTAMLFLEYPSEDYFYKPEFQITKDEGIELLRLRNESIYAIVMKRPDIVDDILWGELHRGTKIIKGILRNSRLTVEIMPFANERKIGYFISAKNELVDTHMGPPVWGSRKTGFIKKYIGSTFGPWVNEDNILLVSQHYKGSDSKSRIIEKLSNLSKIPLPQDISNVARDSQLLIEDQVFDLHNEFPEEIFQFITRKKPYIVVAEKNANLL
ncbi:MAG: CCA tRNA nucleotidyltransferase, partial [Candidatus Korarchaeota archaeon]